MDTYELDAIAEALGLQSKHAARKRVHAIRESLEKRGMIVYDTQRGNALTVTLEGMNILQRMNDLPGSIAEQAEALRIELGDIDPPPSQDELRAFKAEVKEWQGRHRDEHKDLKARLDALETRVGLWARIRHALMPPRS